MGEAGNAATLEAIRVFVALVSVAAVTALAASRLRIPVTVVLVALGLVAGALLPAGTVEVTPELVLLVLVPGLVFEAALNLELPHLRNTFGWLALLAAPGVLLSAVVVAVALQVAVDLPFELGIVVGSMVAATDPVAVVATFRNLGAPARLRTLVEGESLFNDGTALVLFVATVSAVTAPMSMGEMAFTISVTVVTSILIGLVAGWLASRLIKLVDDHSIELTISLAAAYGTYILADWLQQSGVLATVVAGVVIGTYGRAVGLSRRALEALDTVWEFIAFLLTALAFLLVGLAISFGDLLAALPAILAGLVGILVGRAAMVYGLLGLSARFLVRGGRREAVGVPVTWLHVMFWAGLRGAVAVAMALALPADFPERSLLQQIAFGVVLFTLFVQGTTARRVVERAGVTSRRPAPDPAPMEA